MWEVWFIQSFIIFLPRKHLPFLVVGSSRSSGRLFVAVLLHKPKKSPVLVGTSDSEVVPSNFGDLILFFSRKSRFSGAVGESASTRRLTNRSIAVTHRLSIPAYDTIAMR